MSPVRHQAIIWVNTGILFLRPMGIYLIVNSIEIKTIFMCGNYIETGCHFFGVNVFNTLWPRQHGRHFPDDISRCIFLTENIWIAINISLSFVPKGPIDNIPALVQVMAWRRSGDKPLSEPMMVSLLTHICATRPQWVKMFFDVLPAESPPSWSKARWIQENKVKDCSLRDILISGKSSFFLSWRTVMFFCFF